MKKYIEMPAIMKTKPIRTGRLSKEQNMNSILAQRNSKKCSSEYFFELINRSK